MKIIIWVAVGAFALLHLWFIVEKWTEVRVYDACADKCSTIGGEVMFSEADHCVCDSPVGVIWYILKSKPVEQ